MKIVGCDFHPSYQQVAVFDTSTGEIEEFKLKHSDGQAERFYLALPGPALIGMEATGNSLWFERLVENLGHELRVGDAAQIRASYVRKQKTDKRDAGHILKLLLEDRFPKIWVPNQQQRDVRQLLVHRHKLVQVRTRLKTELQHLRVAGAAVGGGATGRAAGQGRGASSWSQRQGTVADEPARNRAHYRPSFCDDHRRGVSLSTQQAGVQLSGTDPE